MHPEAWVFVQGLVPEIIQRIGHVVELGSRNFNGSIRSLFVNALSYTGVDILPGYGVDVVADAAAFSPEIPPDLILCCETLEHTPRGEDIIQNAGRILAPGGQLVITCATDPRAPHSAIDGGNLYVNEYYANVPPDDLARWMEQAGLTLICHQVHVPRGDLYAVAQKPEGRTLMANPIISWLKGDHLPRRIRNEAQLPEQRIQESKLYLYPDYINPSIAMSPDVNAAIRLGTLVHGPGATEMTYRAWHYEDMNSAVFACLTAIATAYPEAPAKVFLETKPGERDEQPDHPLQQLLDNPNPVLPSEHLWHWVQWCKHIGGNAYLRKIRAGSSGGGNVVQLWPISPTRIQPVTTKEDALRGVFISWYEYVFDPDMDPERIPPEDIVHFRLGLDDKDHRMGAAPLARLMREVAGDDEAHKWQTSMLENGGTVGMLIQVPIDSSITVEQAEDMKARFEERFGGANRGRTGVLMGGAKAEPYGFAPEDMDMKTLHRIPEERIAAVLRVPAIIAGLGAGLDRSTYSNFREASEMFAEKTLLPLYAFDAATLNMQLTPEFTTDKRVKVAFDVSDLRAFQEDEDAKWKRLDTAVKTGWIRPNEARTDVGLPPDMDDDAPLRSQMAFGAGSEDEGDDEQQALPAGKKQMPGKIPSQRTMRKLPAALQALIDLAEPSTQEELEGYLDGQRKRIKRRLVG